MSSMHRAILALLAALSLAACWPSVGDEGAAVETSGESSGSSESGESGTSTGESGDDQPLPPGCDYHFVGGQHDREAIQTALSEAADDATLCFEGSFELAGRLFAFNLRGLTLRGIGEGQGVGAGALLDFGHAAAPTAMKFENIEGLTLEHFTITNVAGEGIEVRNSTSVVFRDLRASSAAAEALRCVESTEVSFESCEAGEAAVGIYVGRSSSIVVRDSVVVANDAGIELDNVHGAELDANLAHDNGVGILVADLPHRGGNGAKLWIHDNECFDNDRIVAGAGSLAALLGPGLGILVVAVDELELFANLVHDNDGAGLAIVSHRIVELLDPPEQDPDPLYDPYPEHLWIHDNLFADNGQSPAGVIAGDVVWDGAFNASKDNSDGWLNVCMQDNGELVYLNFDDLGQWGGPNSDMSPHDCVHDPIGP